MDATIPWSTWVGLIDPHIDLDEVSAPQLAAWRDGYVATDPKLDVFHSHVDLCVDELTRRRACWRCRRPSSMRAAL